MIIAERIKDLCAQKGTSLYALEKQLGLGNGTIGKWGKNGRVPNYAKLSAVCEALGVSVEDVMSDQQEKPAPSGDELSKEAIEIARTYERASAEIKRVIEAALKVGKEPDRGQKKITVTCPMGHGKQDIWQPVVHLDGYVIPYPYSNGCELYSGSPECEQCRQDVLKHFVVNSKK